MYSLFNTLHSNYLRNSAVCLGKKHFGEKHFSKMCFDCVNLLSPFLTKKLEKLSDNL